jgi:hypothetical protein
LNSQWPSDLFSRRLGALAQLAQIAAIAIAGVWVFFVWIKTVQPSTATGLQVEGKTSVSWSETNKACKASFRITVENVGTREVNLSSAKYSVVAIPSARLSPGEKMRVLTSVDTVEKPIEGELRGVPGRLVPKEKRFKEVWFIFRPDRSNEYSIEVIIDEGRSDILTKWHGAIESCDLP